MRKKILVLVACATTSIAAFAAQHAAPAYVTFDQPTYGQDKTLSWAAVPTAAQYYIYASYNGGAYAYFGWTSTTSMTITSSYWAIGTLSFAVTAAPYGSYTESGKSYSATRTITIPAGQVVNNSDNSFITWYENGKMKLLTVDLTSGLPPYVGNPVWGLDIYSVYSMLSHSAVHWYGMATGQKWVVCVKFLPGQSSYMGATQNGITSQSDGPEWGSAQFAGYAPYQNGTLAAPSSITFNTPTYGTSQTLNWGAVSYASYYIVQVSRDGGGYVDYTTTGSTSITIPASEFSSMGTRAFRVMSAASNYNSSDYTTSATRTVALATQASLTLSPSSIQTYGTTRSYTAGGGSGTGAYSDALISGSATRTSAWNYRADAGSGSYVIRVTRAGDANYSPLSTDFTLSMAQASQTVTFPTGSWQAKAYGDAPFTLSATASSGLGVTFQSLNTGVATVSGSTVTLVGVGTATIRASQAGNANYTAATNIDCVLTVGKGNQMITFPTGTWQAKTYGDAPFNLSATASSGLGVTFQSLDTSVATVSGSTVTLVGAGTATIRATQVGNANYTAATNVDCVLTVAKASQTITFPTGAWQTKKPGDKPFDLAASASSGLTVTFESLNTNVAVVSASTVTIVGVGTASLRASQAGDAGYEAASSVERLLTVSVADTLFVNGTIHLDADTTASALAVAGGVVIATGSVAVAAANASTHVVNLAGGAVWPGLIDSHTHYLGGSFISMGVRLNTATPMADMAAIRSAVAAWIGGPTDAGAPTWIFGFGWNTAVLSNPDGRLLDDIGRPVVLIDGGGHSCIANSAAMSLGGITDATVVPGGEIVRDADGHATGLLKENAVGLVLGVALQQTPDALFGAAIPTVTGALASQGVTGISEIMGMPGLPISGREGVFRTLESAHSLPLRVHFYVPAYSVAQASNVWSHYAAAALSENTPLVRFAGGKVWVDGGCDSGGADVSFPHVHKSTRYFTLNDLRAFVALAEELGIPVQFHANGDRSVDDVLTALEEAKSARGEIQRHILVHLPFATPLQIQRIKALGVTVCGQPIFWEQVGYATELAEYGGYATNIYDYAALFAAGITPGFGTDWPAVDEPMEDFSPLKGLAVATTSYKRLAEDTRYLTAAQFLRGYTEGSAETVSRPDLGNLRVGATADLVVFSTDPVAFPTSGGLPDVQQTWIGGLIAYSRSMTWSVNSVAGQPAPANGTHEYAFGATLTNHVESSVTMGTTQYVCEGWSLSGHDPATGQGNTVVVTVTNNASLTWLWSTNYYLDVQTVGSGTVTASSNWHLSGSTQEIGVSPSYGWLFMGWSGAVSTGYSVSNLALVMNGPAHIIATFSDDPDGDGLKNIDEWSQGTDPWLRDSDMDGFDDNWEVQHGWNPTHSDSHVLEYVLSNPDTFGIVSTNNIASLAPGSLFIRVTNNMVNLSLQMETSADLTSLNWTNACERVEWSMPVTGKKAFFRVRVKE